MNWLITGIGGFAGGHLVPLLLERDDRVAGLTLEGVTSPLLEPLRERIDLYRGDVRDQARTAETFRAAAPDAVVHLAAVTHVGQAWDRRRLTFETNVVGTASVLEAAGRLDPIPTIVVVSSGQVYGGRPVDARPISEEEEPAPTSPYAASKLCSEVLARQAWRGEGIPAVVVRPFNYAGPGQSPDFVCSDFARQLARLEAREEAGEIRVGNLEPVRDFTDVRDAVRGFVLAATRGEPGRAYNLASGRGVKIREILDGLLERCRVPVEVRQDPERLRPSEIDSLVGNPSRAADELGWVPEIELERTLDDVIDYWRSQPGVGDDRLPVPGEA